MSTPIGSWLNENTPGFDDEKPPEDNDLVAEGTDYRKEYFQERAFLHSNIGLAQDDETGVPGFLDGTIAGDSWESYANLRNVRRSRRSRVA